MILFLKNAMGISENVYDAERVVTLLQLPLIIFF